VAVDDWRRRLGSGSERCARLHGLCVRRAAPVAAFLFLTVFLVGLILGRGGGWSCQDVRWSPHDIPDSAQVGHRTAAHDDASVVRDRIVIVATLTAKLVTNGGRSAWLVGVLALMVYALPVAAPNSVKGTLTATTVGGDNADASMCNRPPLGENGTDSAETVAVRMVVKVD
jgi:hypothetical protein